MLGSALLAERAPSQPTERGEWQRGGRCSSAAARAARSRARELLDQRLPLAVQVAELGLEHLALVAQRAHPLAVARDGRIREQLVDLLQLLLEIGDPLLG